MNIKENEILQEALLQLEDYLGVKDAVTTPSNHREFHRASGVEF